MSGLGKGITAASLGRLLKARGLKVAAQKLDPYINVDPGTMSPYQHGEVYVTEDGGAHQGTRVGLSLLKHPQAECEVVSRGTPEAGLQSHTDGGCVE